MSEPVWSTALRGTPAVPASAPATLSLIHILLKTIKEEPLGDHILDLGCGYGVIGVTVKKMFPDAEMLMVDVNPRAVELAVLNAQKNSVEAEVRVSDIFGNVTETLSDILTNPPIRAGKNCLLYTSRCV